MEAANPPLARVRRGGYVESIHRGVVVVARGGEPILRVGDAAAPQFLRSTAKPFQALATLEVLLGAGFPLSDADIAVVASSHAGQPMHVALVQGMLDRGGIPASALQCGAHPPGHAASAAALVRADERPSALHNNCSGKHAAMLIASKILGAPLEGYLDRDHPVQRRAIAMLACFAEVAPADVGVAIDGCSAPTFILPGEAIARAYSNLTRPSAVPYEGEAWGRLLASVPAQPVAYCGEGKICTRLLQMLGSRVYPKVGAEGVYALSLNQNALGIMTKFDDGSHRATEALVARLLLRFCQDLPDDAREALEAMTRHPLRNWAGTVVGDLEIADVIP